MTKLTPEQLAEQGFMHDFEWLDTAYSLWIHEGKEVDEVEEDLRAGYEAFLTRGGQLLPNGKIKKS